jgi:cytochrome c biogenesis protein CcmG, thiol:disulfide interchange protein DsbE
MSTRAQWSIVLVVVAVLGLAAWAAVHFYGDEIFPVEVGSKAPQFHAHRLHSTKQVSLDDYKGQVVLINVWATWCGPCRIEMPSIESLYRTYGPAGLKVVGVSIDDVGDDQIEAFAKEFGLTFDIVHDSSFMIEKDYQVTGYPSTFVVAKDGVIRKKWIGQADWNSGYNRALVATLLGVSPSQPVAATDSSPHGTTAVSAPVVRRPATAPR